MNHNHDPNDESLRRDELVKYFWNIIVERSKKETEKLRLIYDEESIKYGYFLYFVLITSIIYSTRMLYYRIYY